MLTVRTQAIDGTGTFTLSDSQPCRLLMHQRGSVQMRDMVRQAADLPGLMRRLEALVEDKAKSPLTASGRAALESGITKAIMVYTGTKFATELKSQFTLHEIMSRSLASSHCWSMSRTETRSSSGSARRSGSPSVDGSRWTRAGHRHTRLPTGDPAEQRAAARHRRLLADLHAISRGAVPAPPAKRKRGAPTKKGRRDPFHDLINDFATCWERATGKPFSQHWYDKKKLVPANSAAQFVQAVVEVVAPARLRSLPKMTEQIVRERRAHIS